jgi:GAF domain-containing protein
LQEEAVAMKEEAVEMSLRVWLERLKHQWPCACPGTLFERALDAALSVASADYANIQMIHPSGRGLLLKAQRGFGQPFLDFFATVDDCHTACGLALKERRPIVVQDIVCSPIFMRTRGLQVMLGAGIRAVTSTPLVGGAGQVWGMLSVYYSRPRRYVDSDLTRFQKVAKAVAALIEGGSAASG